MATPRTEKERLFNAAAELTDPARRAAFLDAACGEDAALRAELEDLLRHDEAAGSFLQMPALAPREGRPLGAGAGDIPTNAADPAGAPAGDEPAATVESPGTVGEGRGLSPRPVAEGPGARIGPYKLLQKIGEGGMGVVYLVEQERPVRRKVALKIIKPGMDTAQVVARFEAERQALALMEHPNIARVLDVGSTDSGRPFFVMELVKGVPITEYCDQARLTPRERLELFVPVCQAIQHAHQKGIIHRDIKPSNVLVTVVDGRPVPRVIDFGIAKATDQRLTERTLFTQHGAIVGTLEYMSPEQAEPIAQDVDTRSDIYTLGVLLYELLTGTTPLERARLCEAGYAEILRRIRDEEPPRPSARLSDSGERLASIAATRRTEPARLTRLVRGELDWIVMKALEKDRSRRYDSAGGFARDLERYLTDEAVEACPPSRRYRLGKFVRAHRAALAVSATIATILLASAVIGTSLATRAIRAEHQAVANLAESRRAEARAQSVSRFMVEAFGKADPDQDGRKVSVVDVLDRAAVRLREPSAGPAEDRGVLLAAVGKTYQSLALNDRALGVLKAALPLLEGSLGPDHPEAIGCRADLCEALINAGRPAEGIALVEEALRLPSVRSRPDAPETLKLLIRRARAYNVAGRSAEAVAALEEVVRSAVAKLGPEDDTTLEARGMLAQAYYDAGRTSEGIALMEETSRQVAARYGTAHSSVLWTRYHLGSQYLLAGRPVEGAPMLEQSLAAATARLGPDNPLTLQIRLELGRSLREAGRTAEAIAQLEETIKLAGSRLVPVRLAILARDQLSQAYLDAGRASDALAVQEENLRLCLDRLGPDHPDTIGVRASLVQEKVKIGRPAEAIALAEEVLRPGAGRTVPDDDASLVLRMDLGAAYRAVGRLREAIALHEEVLKSRAARLGPDHPDTITARNHLAVDESQAGRVAEAIALSEENLKLGAGRLRPDHNTMLAVRSVLGEAYWKAGRLDEAIAIDEEFLRLSAARHKPDTLETIAARNNLATAYGDAGRAAEAIPLHEANLKSSVARKGPDHVETLMVRNNLAMAYKAAGRLPEAIERFEDLARHAAAVLGPDHFATLWIRKNLAEARGEAGRKDEAIAMLRDLVPAIAKAVGPDHPRTISVVSALAELDEETGRWAEGEALLRDRLATFQAQQPDRWETDQVRSLLGACLAGLRRFDEAEPLVVAGYDRMKAREGTIPKRSRRKVLERAAERGVRLYEAWGKPEKAEEWRRKVEAGTPPAVPPR